MNEVFFAQRPMFYGRCTCKLVGAEDYKWLLGQVYGQDFLEKVVVYTVRESVMQERKGHTTAGEEDISDYWDWRWKDGDATTSP